MLPAAVQPAPQAEIFPPWQRGQNNDATYRGFEFAVPEVDDLTDFHGDIADPKLVLYVGGNYFFAMAPLAAAFETQHPEFNWLDFLGDTSPGLLVKKFEAGGTVTSGNMTWTAKPDAYFAGLRKFEGLIDQRLLTDPAVPVHHQYAPIMMPKGNPGHVTSLADLGEPDIRLAMPNPEFEGIARQIEASLRKAGGQALADAVYKTKVADGGTILTHIHHRQTPRFLLQGRAEAGVTRQSEAKFQEQAGHPITYNPGQPEHNGDLRWRGDEGRGPPRGSEALAFLHPFTHRAVDLRALRAQTLQVAENSAQARHAWTEDKSLDAWLTWTIWQNANPLVGRPVAITVDRAIYRDTAIALAQRGEQRSKAKQSAAFLASSQGAAIFAK